MEVLNFVVRLASAVADFGALETLRNAYQTLNKRSTSALVRRVGQQSALETRYGLAHSPRIVPFIPFCSIILHNLLDKERRSRVIVCLEGTEADPDQTEELFWSHLYPVA